MTGIRGLYTLPVSRGFLASVFLFQNRLWNSNKPVVTVMIIQQPLLVPEHCSIELMAVITWHICSYPSDIWLQPHLLRTGKIENHWLIYPDVELRDASPTHKTGSACGEIGEREGFLKNCEVQKSLDKVVLPQTYRKLMTGCSST